MKASKFVSVLLSVLITLSCLVTATIIPVAAVQLPEMTERGGSSSTTSVSVSGQSGSLSQSRAVPVTTGAASNQPKVVVVTAISTPDGYITGTTAATTTTQKVMSATAITTASTVSATNSTTKSSVSSSTEYKTVMVSVSPLETDNTETAETKATTTKVIYTVLCTGCLSETVISEMPVYTPYESVTTTVVTDAVDVSVSLSVSHSISVSQSVSISIPQSVTVSATVTIIEGVISQDYYYNYEYDIYLDDVTVSPGQTVQIPFGFEDFPNVNFVHYKYFSMNLNVHVPCEGMTVSAVNMYGSEYQKTSSENLLYTFKVTGQSGFLYLTVGEDVPVGEYILSCDGNAKHYYCCVNKVYETYTFNEAAATIKVADKFVTTPALTEPLETTSTTITTTESTTETTLTTTITTTETSAATTENVTTPAVSGDADGNNELNVRDCAFIASSIANGHLSELTLAADFNGDGTVNVRDAATIANYLAKNE